MLTLSNTDLKFNCVDFFFNAGNWTQAHCMQDKYLIHNTIWFYNVDILIHVYTHILETVYKRSENIKGC